MFKGKVDVSNYDLKDYFYNYIFYGRIVRNDYFDCDSEYYYVDELCQGRSALKRYASLSIESTDSIKILLLSDLHLGDKDFETENLISRVYSLAEENGVTVCMILGDVFGEGKSSFADSSHLLQSLKSFRKIVPESRQIKTFCIKGNHDEKFDSTYVPSYFDHIDYCDFRQLSFLKNNFYALPKTDIEVSFKSRGIKDKVIVDSIMTTVYNIQNHIYYEIFKDVPLDHLFSLREQVILEMSLKEDNKDNYLSSSIQIIKNCKFQDIIKFLLLRKLVLKGTSNYQSFTVGDLLSPEDFQEFENSVTLGQVVSFYTHEEVIDDRLVVAISNSDIYQFIQQDIYDKDFLVLFSHKLNVSTFDSEIKISQASDIINHEKWIESTYDLFVSGHLHQGFIYGTSLENYGDKNIFYVNVPSTSKINLGGVVAYILDINYVDNSIDNLAVHPISSDLSENVSLNGEIVWNLKKKNKKLLKEYNVCR